MITLADYSEIIEKMIYVVEGYEKTLVKNNKYVLYLANGDFLDVRTYENNVAHLLGLNIDYLRKSGKLKPNISSYEALKYFLEEAYSFSKLCGQNGPLSFDGIFSKHIYEKLDAFWNNIHINTTNLLYIVKYDNEKVYQVDPVTDVSDYYIVRKEKDGAYYVLGLVKKDGTEHIYTPTTSRKYTDKESFEKFIKRIAYKQELTYSYKYDISNNVTGYSTGHTIYTDKKINMLKNIIKYAKEYEATPSVTSDFLHVISKNAGIFENHSNTFKLLNYLSEKIKNGKVLDEESIYEILGENELNEDVKKLIDEVNNAICSNALASSDGLTEYSKINDENRSLKEELESLYKQLEAYKKENNDLQKQNGILREENELYNEQFELIEGACQKLSLRKKGE